MPLAIKYLQLLRLLRILKLMRHYSVSAWECWHTPNGTLLRFPRSYAPLLGPSTSL